MLDKKLISILVFIFIFSINSVVVLSVNITTCKSDSIDWLCERDRPCVCEISGTCTDGNLLVYEEGITNLICAPQISDRTASIDWTICETTENNIKVRADCKDEQSSEKMIILTGAAVTTTVPTTTTSTPTTEYTGTCGIDGYCEFKDNECLEDYEDCSEYEHECYTDEKCCCSTNGGTPTTIPSKSSGFDYGWIIGFLIIIVIVVIVYFFFIKKGKAEQEIKHAFRKLYEKWTRTSTGLGVEEINI